MCPDKSHHPSRRPGTPRRARSSASKPALAGDAGLPLHEVIEHIDYAIFVCAAQPAAKSEAASLRILFANSATQRATGLDPSKVLATDLISLLACKSAGLRRRLDHIVRAGIPATIASIECSVGQVKREFGLAAMPLNEPDQDTTHWAFVLREVTPLQRLRGWGRREQEMEEIIAGQEAKLQTSQETLQRSERMATLGTLVAGLGHDLNNLLMPIRGHLRALGSLAADDNARLHVQAIGQAIDYIQQLNDNLRLFALDPAGPDDTRGTTDIAGWWDRLRPVLERATPQSMLLMVDLPRDLPAIGVAAHRLTQAVLNLLINASEAITGEGTIRLWAHISAERQFVSLGVTDSGCGMPQEVQRRAFEPFFTTKQRGRATGLGLSLVHGIVHAAGGSVAIDSVPGRGTTMVLKLPVAASEAVGIETTATGQQTTAAVSVRDRRIAACFEALLESAGFIVQAPPTRGPACVDLWVTEPSARSLGAAKRLRAADPDCRIVVFGTPSDEWLALGALSVGQEGGLPAMREALTHAISVKL